MTEGRQHVYRVAVVWPAGTPARVARARRYRFLTRAGAEHRAAVLRERGATATVLRSDPITWPEETPDD